MSTEAQNTVSEATEGVESTEADKVNTGALGTLVAVGLFAMLSICLAVAALVRHDMEEEQADMHPRATSIAARASSLCPSISRSSSSSPSSRAIRTAPLH